MAAPSGSDLSRLRGASQREAIPTAKPSGAIDRAGSSRGGEASPSGARTRKESAPAGDARERLGRKIDSDPKAGREILEKGKFTSKATDIATRTAAGVGVGISTGTSTGCFWDPCYTDPGCSTVWDWWCSPGWGWGWSTWCTPWWGFGWGFGYCSDWWWYGGYPYYGCYPSAYYAPYPAYYSTVIYDSYDSAPVAAEPTYVDPEVPVAQGEGAIQVAGYEGDGENRPRLASSQQFLTLGDQAFREGRYSEAVHYYARAVELEPERGVLHLILSDALFATGDYHYAAYSLRRALELDPAVVDEIVDKHKFYGDPGEFDRQIQILESYLGDHFLDDDARLLLSANYLFGGQPAQAADLLLSPFSVAIRESGAGRILLERTQSLRRARESESSPR
jgi:hypothetical protein